MPGAATTLGFVAVTATLAVGLAAASSASVFGQRLAGAADAAALAAADAAAGAVIGVPCERAAEVAEASGVALAECDLDGLVATVEVAGRFGLLPCAARARAGPSS
jgi:secretion/DNA translocation related TadE-like protein